ncbi:hypothetical protein TBLA_0J01690 [Henningerozyma blattae CBS 6284]|uniref:Protoporphyrinogen oxidase n=1 Tax=Henningerozyma blattae (strain ATCC 34711 / CBS 6284 / DSM 70876 / NBRC 10599 / NRRL Y-10934 / UCD 77-7) TaxID=1071380 RepID=I2H9W1_HENB6|nr:hypothetical protein TBLA_0J01690 [Tetrapisispora blattae CBS 6284]CCH63163.1 hypothetical protein TBLA_0J01690 [Tetrapisispora blattae CBS 6284]
MSLQVPRNGKVCVIGSGVAGLTFSYLLNQLRPDVHIDIYEKQERSGGWLNSHHREVNGSKVMLERGPRTLRGKSDGSIVMIDIMRRLGQLSQVQYVGKKSQANRQFLLNGQGRLVEVPKNWTQFAKFVMDPISGGLVRGMAHDLLHCKRLDRKTYEDESVGQLLARRFGSTEIGDRIISGIYHGIYAGDMNEMSSLHTGRRFVEDEMKYGSFVRGMFSGLGAKPSEILSGELMEYNRSIGGQTQHNWTEFARRVKQSAMLGFAGGLEQYPLALRAYLEKQQQVRLRLGQAVASVLPGTGQNVVVNGVHYDHVRSTLNPSAMAAIFPEIQGLQHGDFKSVSVYIMNVYVPGTNLIRDAIAGFGYLVPQRSSQGDGLLGVIFDSVVERNYLNWQTQLPRHQDDCTKMTLMVGGHYLNKGLHLDLHKCLGHVSNHLGVDLAAYNPVTQNLLARDGIPVFDVGFDKKAARVVEECTRLYAGHVTLGGVGFARGPGVPDVVMHELAAVLHA